MFNQSKTALAGDKKRFLGISAKSSHTSGAKKPNPDTGSLNNRRMKYALQRTAQSLLFDYQSTKQHRVCSCHRNIASDGVVIYRSTGGLDARLANLMTCGSAWSCPVCAAKITEQKRVDMQRAQNAWLMEGGSCLLMTLTYPHENDIPLDESLIKFEVALNEFKKSRTYGRIFGTSLALVAQRIKKNKPMAKVKKGQFPRLGTVRSLEVTHGVNGWHPHVHEVLFMNDDALLHAAAMDELKQAWVKALLVAGLGNQSDVNDMLLRALDIRGGDYVSDYINKFGREPVELRGWTIAHEVTKGNVKMGKSARKIGNEFHYTPFQLLAFATDGDESAGELFKEFSRCFEGKRQNYWSNGLKEWFGINDQSDDEMATDQPEQPEEEFVIRIDAMQWKDVLMTNSRGLLLTVAAALGHDGVVELLDGLRDQPKTHRGWFNTHSRPNLSRFYK